MHIYNVYFTNCQIRDKIKKINVTVKVKLFTCSNQCYEFFVCCGNCSEGLTQLYLKEHSNFLLIQSAFNYFAKNKLKCLNAPTREDPGPKVQKIEKLTSKSAQI